MLLIKYFLFLGTADMTSNSSTGNLQSQSNTPPFVRFKTRKTNKNIVIFASCYRVNVIVLHRVIKINHFNLKWKLYYSLFFVFNATFSNQHGDQFQWGKKQEYPQRTTVHGQATVYPLDIFIFVFELKQSTLIHASLFCKTLSRATGKNLSILKINNYQLNITRA